MFFVYFLFIIEFPIETSVKLDIPFPTAAPSVAIETNGNIWCTSYWDNAVYKMNNEGLLIFKIGGTKGYGPGELVKPLSVLLFEDSNTIVIHGAGMKLSSFNMATGTFIRILDVDTPFIRVFPWDETSFIGYTNPSNVNGGFSQLDLSGRKKAQWFTQRNISKITNSSLPYTKGNSDTVYFQEGVKPEVNIIRKNESNYSIWKLNLPLNYIEPPSKPIKREYMFNKEKLEEFYSSFSLIKGLSVFKDKYMIVCWNIPKRDKNTYQIYDLEERKQITREFYIDGILVNTPNGFYTLSLKQNENDYDDEYYKLNKHKWSIN
ncbi:MAG: hypothetical protein CSA81_12915 [Acidobacteria bacterium]|nr:MAG: hypothetical protein CSA81_12915 [Acidobacteriota bacterium]PIE89120.1 MAG: hypothetical protein CR997_12655 [Acidobacteriota bacterium]